MTAEGALALLGLQLLYLAAGTGVTSAASTLTRTPSLGPRPAIAWACGVAATTLATLDLTLAGVRPTRPVVIGVALAIGAAGLAIAWLRGLRLATARFQPRPPLGPFPWIGVVFAAVAGLVLLTMLDASWDRGVANFDAWTFWVPKALVLHYFGADVGLLRDVVISNTEPLFAPMLQASAFALVGSGDTMIPSVQYVLLLAMFVLAAAALLRQVAPASVAWPPLLLLLVMPHVVRRAMAPEGDFPWEYFFALAVLGVVLWAVHRRDDVIVPTALFLAAAVSAKREGAFAFVILAVATPILVDGARRRSWRAPALAGLFVIAVSAPWWLWVQRHVHAEGRSTAAAAMGGCVLGAVVWWASRFGRRAVVALPVVPLVLGLPAWRLLHSAATVRFGQLPSALHVAGADLFAPKLWLVGSIAGLALLVAAGLAEPRGRVVPFVLVVSAGLFAVFVARLLACPLSYYPHPSLTPTTRNCAAIVFLWLLAIPLLIARLIDLRGLLPSALDRPVPVPAAVAAAPAVLFAVVAVAQGDFATASPTCAIPVTNGADAAFVFGHVKTQVEAQALQKRVQGYGFAGTEILPDACAGLRVVTPHLTVKVAREQQVEAKHVGIDGSIEQSSGP